jgi:hypothetical protein
MAQCRVRRATGWTSEGGRAGRAGSGRSAAAARGGDGVHTGGVRSGEEGLGDGERERTTEPTEMGEGAEPRGLGVAARREA